MKSYQIAFMPIIRSTFDVQYANEAIGETKACLEKCGYDLVMPKTPISDLSTAEEAGIILESKPVDLVIIFQATFADSTLVSRLLDYTNAPIFLWAIPEPWTGSRLRLNSLCGINLAAHSMALKQQKYDYGYGQPNDENILSKIAQLSRVGSLLRKLRYSRFGVVGEHPLGFDSCQLDEELLEQVFGVQIEQIDLDTVFNLAKGFSNNQVDYVRKALDNQVDELSLLDQTALSGTLRVYLALNGLSTRFGLSGLAIKCWPEFFEKMGCAACGAMSMLSDGFEGNNAIPCGCEADINGTLTQYVLQTLAEKPAFGTDIVGVDIAENKIAIWHCGLAPLSMAKPGQIPVGTIHSNRKLPLLFDFTLKPGQITLARISQSSGNLKLVIGEGEILGEPKPYSGTAGTLRLNYHAKDFLDDLLYQGLEHHISFTYGKYAEDLVTFAKFLDLPIVKIGINT